jgi:predicted RNase H-like HicB family nuclease
MLLVLAAAMSTWSHAALAQQRWAAIDPNSEGSSPVAWGATEEEARQRAVEACKRVSKTCASGPASTNDMKEVFAVMCCTQPRPGCAASAAASRRDALKNVQEMFADAGYKDCSARHYMSAATGKKQ